jgi:hypothetical protein
VESHATDKVVELAGTHVMDRPIWVDYANQRRASAVAREEAGAAAAVEDGEVTWEAARLAAAMEDAGATGEVAAAVEGVADEEGTVSAEEGEDRRSTRRRLQ